MAATDNYLTLLSLLLLWPWLWTPAKVGPVHLVFNKLPPKRAVFMVMVMVLYPVQYLTNYTH
jgi:hypothetical protein